MSEEPNYEAWNPSEGFIEGLDRSRLITQTGRVFQVMRDGQWHTLHEISEKTGAPEASISADLRLFRREEWGAYVVERKRSDSGLHYYRLGARGEGTPRKRPCKNCNSLQQEIDELKAVIARLSSPSSLQQESLF